MILFDSTRQIPYDLRFDSPGGSIGRVNQIDSSIDQETHLFSKPASDWEPIWFAGRGRDDTPSGQKGRSTRRKRRRRRRRQRKPCRRSCVANARERQQGVRTKRTWVKAERMGGRAVRVWPAHASETTGALMPGDRAHTVQRSSTEGWSFAEGGDLKLLA